MPRDSGHVPSRLSVSPAGVGLVLSAIAPDERVPVTEAKSGADLFGRLRRGVLFETGSVYFEDRALRLGAGLAYYGVVTMAPLLVLFVGLAGLVAGTAHAGQVAQIFMFGAEAPKVLARRRDPDLVAPS